MRAPKPRPWVDRIEPYVPGTPAPAGEGSLASNESSTGPPAAVLEAVAGALGEVNRYPDPLAASLRDALGALHGVDPDQILVGNGSDELVYLIASAYAGCGGRVLCATPPYRINEVSAVAAGAQVVHVPLAGWRHDLPAMAALPADVAFIVNPHNPTGTTCTPDELARFVERAQAGLTVIDEAYIHFADDPAAASALPLAQSGRAVVLRTFSKLFGLAGARVGYLVAAPAVVETLRKVRAPFSVSALAQAAALAALGEHAHYERLRAETIERRGELAHLFEERGYETVPSQANFVLVTFGGDEEAARALVSELAEGGISVREGSRLGAPGTVRVSVPSAAGLRLLGDVLPAARALLDSGRR